MRSALAWIGFVFVLGASRPAWAQYRIDIWTTEQGLPQHSINDVLQTRDGFIWLTTYAGLVRFDGITMHVFNTVSTPALGSSRLGVLFEDRSGALWVMTEGSGIVRYQDRVFKTYTVADGLPDNRVSYVFEDADGRLVVDTPKGLVAWRDGRFVPDTTGIPSAVDKDRQILEHDASGAVWYADAMGVHKYKGGRVIRSLPIPKPMRMLEDRSGRVWIESADRQLQCVVGDQVITYGAQDGVPTFSFSQMYEDRDGTIWIGLRGGPGAGLLRFRDATFTRYTTADGLPDNHVGLVHQDREGTIWVPTDNGLVRLTSRPITTHSTTDGLAVDNTYPILQDRRGDIWIGGWPGLTRYRDGVFQSATNEMGIAGDNVLALFADRDDGLWIGTWNGRVRRVKDGRVEQIPRGGPGGRRVRAIYQDAASRLWIGGLGGVARLTNGAFSADDAFSGGDVYVFHEDRLGTLWMGTDRGVTRYRDGVFTNIGEAQGPTGAPVRAIYEDQDGSLWLGTYDSGLFRMKDGRFTRYTTREGLPTNGAFHVIEDQRGWLWMTSNVGIFRVARKELDDFAAGRSTSVTSVVYGKRDGMRDVECNGGGQPAGIRARDGRIWFPTQQGVAVFDPTAIPINALPPPVVITDLLVGNTPVDWRDGVEIRSGSTALEVQFAALTFVRPELSRFKFRMEGLDAEWVDAGSQRVAHYAQLPYGNFRFRVIAANRDGVWNEEGATVQVVVVPPFWRTPWFLTLMVLSAAAAGFGVHQWRIGLLQQQQALREAFARQLIESQEDERKRIAASLHDSLSQTLILMKNWALMGQRKLAPEHQSHATFAQISDAASDALGEVREISYNLGPYQLERLGLAQTILEMVEKVSGAAGIRFVTDVAEPGDRLSKDARINVFRIIQEAITNIVKHAGATEASLGLACDRDVMRVTIQDNGRGFDQTAASPGTPRKQGFGLFGMSERMRMIGGRLAVDTVPGAGTTIRLELPLSGPPS